MTSEASAQPPRGAGTPGYNQTLSHAPALAYPLARAWREYAAPIATVRLRAQGAPR
ncbi:hypothetical protein [Salinisphaera sp. S4-8]|uniref:hypothetical protein n=1 Tax=Salinisphaera sp. S4-8 TaxID=633357 RepID=UPI003340321E